MSGRGNFSDPPGCGRGPRDPALQEPAGTVTRNGGPKRRRWPGTFRSRSAGQTAPGGALGLNYARSQESRTCAARRTLPERTRTVGICGLCEPDSGDLPKWAQDQTGNCRQGRTVRAFRAGSAHTRDDGAQRRQVLLHRGPHGGGHILVFMAINNARAGARVSPICSARSPMRRKRPVSLGHRRPRQHGPMPRAAPVWLVHGAAADPDRAADRVADLDDLIIATEMLMGGLALGCVMSAASRVAGSPGVFAGIVEIAIAGLAWSER